jgi:TPR repeat protein
MFIIPGEGITLPCQIANMYQKQYDKLKESSDSADAEVAKQYLAESVKWLRKAAEKGDRDALSRLVGLARQGIGEAGEAIRTLAKDETADFWIRDQAEDYVEGYSRSGEWRLGSELEDPDDWFGEELDEEDENAGEETK